MLSVYGHFKDGSCRRLGKDLTATEAKEIADRHHKETRCGAVIIIQEEVEKEYEHRRNRRNAYNH